MSSKKKPRPKQSTPADNATTSTRNSAGDDTGAVVQRHLRFGWVALLVFVIVGAVLESLHGFKVAWYLNVGEETRRLLWRLAHAHGTFLGLINLAFAMTVHLLPNADPPWRKLASPCLLGASIAIPAGFFLGGTITHGGDPGIGIIVLPFGVVLLVSFMLLCVWGVMVSGRSGVPDEVEETDSGDPAR